MRTGASCDSILVTNPGTHTCIVSSTETSCTDTGSIKMVNAPRSLKPTITFTNNILICESDADAYQWYRNNIRLSAGINKIYNRPANGWYKVCVIDSASCTNTSDELTIELGVEDIYRCSKRDTIVSQSGFGPYYNTNSGELAALKFVKE